MTFSGMGTAEYEDIQRLNTAFLDLARTAPATVPELYAGLPAALADALAAGSLGPVIASMPTPYLLYRPDFDAAPTSTPIFATHEAVELATLTLAFLQRFARRDRFGLRIAAGLGAADEERLRSIGVAEFGRIARGGERALRPVLADVGFFWPGLMTAAAAGDTVRLATLLSLGHQHVLGRVGLPPRRRAARALTAGQRIADR